MPVKLCQVEGWKESRCNWACVPVVERCSQILICDPASPLALRQTNIKGGPPFPCNKASSPCAIIGRAGYTISGGLLPMVNFSVFGVE